LQRSSHKEHKGREDHKEEERDRCPKAMRGLYDKITDKNSFPDWLYLKHKPPQDNGLLGEHRIIINVDCFHITAFA